MFRSVKLNNTGLTIFSLVCAAAFVAVCFLALRAGAPDTVDINGESYSLRADSDGDIEAFISVCGYETEGAAYDREITVPKVWNETYSEYNELQLEQGLDLSSYKGKPARELVYAQSGGDDYITVLVSDGRIIAAHICGSDGSDIRKLIIRE